jgi:hypothetical protein
MDKKELIALTLDTLLFRFKSSPECFELQYTPFTKNDFSITWRPMIELEEHMQSVVNDPMNSHSAVIVRFHMSSEISCFLFMDNHNNSSLSSGADCVITIKPFFLKLSSNYRKLNKLKNLIIQRDINNEGKKYFGKLSSIFPDVIETYITGK